MTDTAKYPQIVFRSRTLTPEIDARTDTGRSRNETAFRDLERYYALQKAQLAALDLTEAEWMLLRDALNGTVNDASTARMLWAQVDDALRDGLAGKWDVDGQGFVQRLRELSPAQCLAVVDAVERWWIAQG